MRGRSREGEGAMRKAPTGVRMHIGIVGRRNAGKSSLLNALSGQKRAIVSDVPGTTTDVVVKPMELKPLGPVVILDTAGIDDVGELGGLRVERTYKALDRMDMALLVVDRRLEEYDRRMLDELRRRRIPVIVVFNKADLGGPDVASLEEARRAADAVAVVSCTMGEGIGELKRRIVEKAPREFVDMPPILADLVGPSDVVVLVVPIDLEAPKGRLILPQVQVIREVLDCDARAVVVKERELYDTLELLRRKPDLVVVDSQVVLKVAGDVPEDVPLTTFSILFARWKGELEVFVRGTRAIDELRPGDRVLIAESCSHHPVGEDIGRVKIPRWLTQYVGGELAFTHVQGHDFPSDLAGYSLVVHCGGCMTNRREILSRIMHCEQQGVPITNYGLCISKSLGILERVLEPFPEAACEL